MKISSIKESGSNNVLRWAINNGADIKSDIQLQSIINDETFYLVTLDGVNFFELFRLTQIYRKKLRIMNEKKAEVPSDEELLELFEGEYIDEEKGGDPIPFYQLVSHSINMFMNLIPQMEADDDIIRPSTLRLFIPMITRRFEVQIPVSFIDLVSSLSKDEANKLFSVNYLITLEEFVENHLSGFNMAVSMAFIKSTDAIRYNSRYEKYLKIVKYFPLNSYKGNTLYKFGLVGFSAFDNISKGEVRFNMFHPDNQTAPDIFKRLKRLPSPLMVDFAVQLPIQYMQIIENSFESELLTISYEASMKEIIDSNIDFDDFITLEAEDQEDTETGKDIETHNNAIEAYRVRINEANHIALNTINTILTNGDNFSINSSGMFSILPSLYSTKAVFTIDSTKKDKYVRINDPIISEMFEEMFEVIHGITDNINAVR